MQNKKNDEVMVINKPDLPVVLEGDVKNVESAVMQAEKWIDLQIRIRQASLKMTLPDQWLDQGGKPYLQIGGSERIAQGWGISISKTDTSNPEWREDSKGNKYYEIKAKVTATFRGRDYEQEGSATSKDKFFGKVGKVLKEESEIAISDIRKKALTNAMNRVIKSIVGLSHVTWEELERAGIKKGKVQAIEYKTAAPEVGTIPENRTPPKVQDTPDGKNWWTSDYNGKLYFITYNENSKLTHAQLIAAGLKFNSEKKTYSRVYSEELVDLFKNNYVSDSDDSEQTK